MRRTIAILVAIIFLLPLQASAKGKKHGKNNEFRQTMKEKARDHREQQKAESKDFRKSLKHSALPQDQKVSAIKEHREARHEENTAFQEQMHAEATAHLSEKLANNEKLTDMQKQEILDRREEQYQKNLAFRTGQYEENTQALDRILGNENLSPEERRTQMKEFRVQQKKENKKYRETRREENRDFRQSFKPEK